MTSYRVVPVVVAWMMALTLWAQVPARPTPPRLVNDMANVLTNDDVLEDTLERFAHYSSNQIVVVTMNDLQGLTPQEMAYKIGQEWGVGDARFNNGVVLLIKPKTASSGGQVFIATGYGVEGVLPDAVCRRIIEQQLIPNFKLNDYEAGVVSALSVIMPILKGEYDAEELLDDDDDVADVLVQLLFIIIFVVMIYLMARNDDQGNHGSGGRNSGTWGGPIIFTGSDWGGSSGSGFGGGYSGGFGGFGGGSFGGGGAGGSW